MYEYKAQVLRIIDGDTLVVNIDLGFDVWIHNEVIRLNGIDTPEVRTTDPVEKFFGTLAKNRIKEYLDNDGAGGAAGAAGAAGAVTLVSKTFKKEKYGRVTADLKVQGQIRSLCATLISEGYAVPYHGQSKESIDRDHLANRERLIFEGKVTKEEIEAVHN